MPERNFQTQLFKNCHSISTSNIELELPIIMKQTVLQNEIIEKSSKLFQRQSTVEMDLGWIIFVGHK